MRAPAFLAALLLASVASPLAAAQNAPLLTFASDEPLEVSVEEGGTAGSASVVIVNNGPAIDELTFAALSDDPEDGEVAVSAPEGSAVTAGGAARIDLEFSSDASLDGFSGHLIATSDEAAAERDLILDAKNELPFSVNLVIFGSLVIAAGLTAIRAITLRKRLDHLIATPGWDFSKSWASTFTVVGAVLGTILASAVLPAAPERFSKETLAGMNLLFGVAILVAPFLLSATETAREVEKDGKKQFQGQGTVGGYLCACALTLTGVIGQLVTIFFLLSEIEAKGALPDQALVFMGVLFFIAVVLVVMHAWKTMGWTALNASPPDKTTPDRGEADEAGLPEPAFEPALL